VTAMPPGRAARPEAASSVAPVVLTTGAPCVLASERPSHPGDERHSAKPSYACLRDFSPLAMASIVSFESAFLSVFTTQYVPPSCWNATMCSFAPLKKSL
jgi:hypothetical protein